MWELEALSALAVFILSPSQDSGPVGNFVGSFSKIQASKPAIAEDYTLDRNSFQAALSGNPAQVLFTCEISRVIFPQNRAFQLVWSRHLIGFRPAQYGCFLPQVLFKFKIKSEAQFFIPLATFQVATILNNADLKRSLHWRKFYYIVLVQRGDPLYGPKWGPYKFPQMGEWWQWNARYNLGPDLGPVKWHKRGASLSAVGSASVS